MVDGLGRRAGNVYIYIYTYVCNKLTTCGYVPLNMRQLCCTVHISSHDAWTQRCSSDRFCSDGTFGLYRVTPLHWQQTAHFMNAGRKPPRISRCLPKQYSGAAGLSGSEIKKTDTDPSRFCLPSTEEYRNFNIDFGTQTEICLCHWLWKLPRTKSWEKMCAHTLKSQISSSRKTIS